MNYFIWPMQMYTSNINRINIMFPNVSDSKNKNINPPITFNKIFTGGRRQMPYNMLKYLNVQIQNMNQSKLFAGLMIIILNLASRFVIFKLPKTVESYMKFTFSRDLLVFAIAWMGTRDIYIALMIVIAFVLVVDFLFNEESFLCVLPATFVDRHILKLEENGSFTPQDIENIKNLAKKIENDYSIKIDKKEEDEFSIKIEDKNKEK